MKTPPRIAIPIPTLHDFDYNSRSWSVYAEAVRQAGGEPVQVPLGLSAPDLHRLIASCQGVLLPGSPADVDPQRYAAAPEPECAAPDPTREGVDTLLLEDAFHLRKPLFGICFGTQFLNVWRGGTLIQDLSVLPVNHKAGRGVAIAHSAAIAPDSLLGEILNTQSPNDKAAESEFSERDGFLRLPINSSHHQALATPGDGLRIVARCPQDAVIEAVEGSWENHFVLGVQWHPERTYAESAASRALFARFLAEAAAWSETNGGQHGSAPASQSAVTA